MPTTRISASSREALRKPAEESGEPLQAILDKAMELYRRQCFLEQSNRAFAGLRANPAAWDAASLDDHERG